MPIPKNQTWQRDSRWRAGRLPGKLATGAIHLTHGRVVCRDQPNPIPVSDVQSGVKKGSSASPRSENRDNEPENPSSRKAAHNK